jgi:hypothetical protein
LEKEARKVWQKHLGNPTPTHKGTIWEVFYMRIKTLCKKIGKAEETKYS